MPQKNQRSLWGEADMIKILVTRRPKGLQNKSMKIGKRAIKVREEIQAKRQKELEEDHPP